MAGLEVARGRLAGMENHCFVLQTLFLQQNSVQEWGQRHYCWVC